MKAALIFSAALCVLIGALPEPAHASQVVGQWYHGNWSCRIDGRPARMRWVVRDDPGSPIAATIPGFGNRCAAGRLA